MVPREKQERCQDMHYYGNRIPMKGLFVFPHLMMCKQQNSHLPSNWGEEGEPGLELARSSPHYSRALRERERDFMGDCAAHHQGRREGERVLMIMAKWWSGINKEKWDESGRENDEKGNKKVLKRGRTIDNPSNIWLF